MPFNAEEELLKIHEVNTWNYAKIIKEADKINNQMIQFTSQHNMYRASDSIRRRLRFLVKNLRLLGETLARQYCIASINNPRHAEFDLWSGYEQLCDKAVDILTEAEVSPANIEKLTGARGFKALKKAHWPGGMSIEEEYGPYNIRSHRAGQVSTVSSLDWNYLLNPDEVKNRRRRHKEIKNQLKLLNRIRARAMFNLGLQHSLGENQRLHRIIQETHAREIVLLAQERAINNEWLDIYENLRRPVHAPFAKSITMPDGTKKIVPIPRQAAQRIFRNAARWSSEA